MKLLRDKIVLIIFLFILMPSAFSQSGEKPTPWQRLFWGGNLGLQLGTVTDIDISPLVGYRLTPRLSAGVGVKYEYYHDSYDNLETCIYGGNLFANYTVIKDISKILPLNTNSGIYFHGEYEALSLDKRIFGNYPVDSQGRFISNNFLAGLGIKQPIGERSSFNILILWNLTEGVNSPYSSPVIRFGFMF